MRHRKSLDGLRAIAVIPVILFHAGWSLLRGGFLGVDIFFVISGYLITTNILIKIQNGDFSFLEFYNRRVRRIIPALFFMLSITTALSFFFMTPNNLKTYGESLIATLLSVNNFLLYMTSGYWGIATPFKPLFHTWSLGVEEQYYALIPIILYLINRFSFLQQKRRYSFFFLFVIAASFFLSLIMKDKEFIFLMLFTRAWEIGAGSLLAVYMLNQPYLEESRYLSLVGLGLIVISYLAEDNHFQILFNSMSIIGTLLILRYHTQQSFWSGLLISKPLCFIGVISYSVYLWHQPILAFLNLYSEYPPSLLIKTTFAFLSIPIGYISWKYIEQPARNINVITNKLFYTLFLFFIILGLGVGFIMYKTFGFEKYNPQLSYGNNPTQYNDSVYQMQNNQFKNNDHPNILIIGNSFARDFINMIRQNTQIANYNIVYLSDSRFKRNVVLGNRLLHASDDVIYVSSAGMDGYVPPHLFRQTIIMYQYLRSHTQGCVYVVGTKNFGWNNNFLKHISDSQLKYTRVYPLKPQLESDAIMQKAVGANYIDIFSLILGKDKKVALFTNTGHLISFDTNHLTKYGDAFLGKIILKNTQLIRIFKQHPN